MKLQRSDFRVDNCDMALFYQSEAEHFAHLQAAYRRLGDLANSRVAQREAAICADTAMDYLTRLLQMEQSQ